jgi:hypothetical protein
MTFEEFEATLGQSTLPAHLPPLLLAMWYDARGDWNAAHEIAQAKEGTPAYDRLHAYLHRVEGDTWNANYWYRRAGSKMPEGSLKDEWNTLTREYLRT